MKLPENKFINNTYCILCKNKGEFLYYNLRDRLYGCKGDWNFRKCQECGLIWLDPMLEPQHIGEAYENYYTHAKPKRSQNYRLPLSFLKEIYQKAKGAYLAKCMGYHFANHSVSPFLSVIMDFFPRRRELLLKSVMWLPWTPGGRLLDVGCGNGRFLLRMRDLGWEVEGVDIDPEAVAQARAQGLTVRQGMLEDQHYPDNYFDALTLSHVIEHVHDPVGLLLEAHRVLKPGGKLVITTPNPESWGHKIFREHWRGLEPPRHLFLYSRRVMAELLRRAGFSDHEMKTTAAIAPGIFVASRNIARRGQHDENVRIPLKEKLTARAFARLEQWWLMIDPDAGEELVVIAKKAS